VSGDTAVTGWVEHGRERALRARMPGQAESTLAKGLWSVKQRGKAAEEG